MKERGRPMDDNLWGNLEPVTGAASKRPSLADAPTKQPMKAGIKPAQQKAPSGDQKRHRRQMNKKAADDNVLSDFGYPCPNCGRDDATDDHSDHVQCRYCGFEFDPTTGTEWTNPGLSPHPDHLSSASTATKESTMTENQTPGADHTEAGLLARLASATTLTEQRAIATLLDDHRASRREAIAMEGSLDWGAMDTPTQHDGPSAFAAQYLSATASASTETGLPSDTHVTEHLGSHRTTADSDWLLDAFPTEVDPQVMHTAMRAQAVGWYENEVWAPVKDSRQEFSVQAHNAARTAGSIYGLQSTAAASVFLDQVEHLYRKDKGLSMKADWSNNDMPKGEGGVPTYVTDGRDSLPVGVDPAKAEKFDENTLGNAGQAGDGDGDSDDPKTGTQPSNAPSLEQGSTPESDKAESPENPLTGDTSVDKSTYDTGAPTDRMNTQSSVTAGEYGGGSPKHGDTATCHADDKPIEFFDGQWMHYSGGPSHNDVYPATPKEKADKQAAFFHHNTPDAGGPMGQQSEWDALAAATRQRKQQLEDQQAKDEATSQTSHAGSLSMFEALRSTAEVDLPPCPRCKDGFLSTAGEPFDGGADTVVHCANCGWSGYKSDFKSASVTADAQSSEWGLGLGIDEGDTPEGDHAEAPTQNNGEGAKDESGAGQGWPTNPDTGGTGNAATSQQGAYTSSLSPNAQVFVQALRTMSSLDDEVSGISGHQIVGFLSNDPTVPENIREALKAGGNPFGGSGARTAKHECEYDGPHHSDDVTAVYHGSTTPTYLCGFHASQVDDYSKFPRKSSSIKTGSISLTNVGVDSDGNGTGTDPQGNKVTFRLTDKERSDLKSVLYSDLAGNFSGVSIEESDIIKSGSKQAEKSTSREPGRWIFEVAGVGENSWSRNSLSYDTREEAVAAAKDLGGRWMGMDMARVRQIPDSGLPAANSESVDPGDPGLVLNYRTGSRKQAVGDLSDDELEALVAQQAVLEAQWNEAFAALKAARVEHNSADPVAVRYREASDAVNHVNRKLDYYIATGRVSSGGQPYAVVRTAARDTGTCSCGRGISYDSQDRKWTHDTDGTPACGKRASLSTSLFAGLGNVLTAIDKQAVERGPSHDPDSVRDLPLHGTVTGTGYYYNEGYDDAYNGRGMKPGGYGSRDKTLLYAHGYDHGTADAKKKSSRTAGMKDCSTCGGPKADANGVVSAPDPNCPTCGGTGFEQTPDGRYSPVPGDPFRWLPNRSSARGDNTFSLSDAKNEDGEWTMSPEQIRAEMNAGNDPEDPDDFYNDDY